MLVVEQGNFSPDGSNDRVSVEYFMDWLRRKTAVAVDTETTGLEAYKGDRIVGVSVGNQIQQFYLPFRHGEGPNLSEAVLRELIALLNTRTLYMHNAAFDLHMLANEGLDLDTVQFEDTMVAVHLFHEQQETFGLKGLADIYLDGKSSADENDLYEVVKEKVSRKLGSRQWKGHMWKLSSATVEPYASTDARLTWGIRELFVPELTPLGYMEPQVEEDWYGLYKGTNEYLRTLVRMERRGVKIDRDLLLRYKAEAAARAEDLLAQLREKAEKPDFNPNSHPQIKSCFGWSSSRAEILEDLAKDGNETAELLLEYRDYHKASTSYYDVYLNSMDSDDVLHPNFQITGTRTGRLSCRHPNLQAVPRYNDRQPIKDLFVARPGYVLGELDLSQAELRVMAYFADVQPMMETFEAGRDLHSDTASRFGLPRDVAKRINLASVYGIGPKAFAANYKVPESQAREWLETYHAGYPEIKRFYRNLMNYAGRNQEIQLPTGRRVHYHVKERNQYDERGWNFGEQRASSNYIQGTVGEIMRIAMLRIDSDPELKPSVNGDPGLHMLLTVHDSILIEFPEGWDPVWTLSRCASHMTRFGDMPLAADGKTGLSWGQMQEVELREVELV